MKASAVSRDLRTPKYKMRVVPSVKHYDREKQKKEVDEQLQEDDDRYDEYEQF